MVNPRSRQSARVQASADAAHATADDSSAFLWLGKAYHAAAAAFEQATGVSAARWRLLFLIHRQRGCTQKFLVQQVRVDPGSITRQLKSLEAEGLIERADDDADNRLTRVALSTGGRAFVEQVLKARRSFLQHMLQGVDAGDLAACIRALERIAANSGDAQPLA